MMNMFAEWRAARDRRQRAAGYLATLLPEAGPLDVEWFLGAVPGLDERVARREQRFATWAIALIVAERDALDDRTASDVAHYLVEVVRDTTRREPDVGRLWAERWRTYSAAIAERGGSASPAARLARVLLESAGVASPSREQLGKGAQWVLATRNAANEALRSAYGVASLPEDIKPSALRPEQRLHG